MINALPISPDDDLVMLGKVAIERASQQLVMLKNNILERASISTDDHVALKTVITDLEAAYNCLDVTFATAEPLASLYERAIELTSFSCERLRILQDFIRPCRLKDANIDYGVVISSLNHDLSIFLFTLDLFTAIILAESTGASHD